MGCVCSSKLSSTHIQKEKAAGEVNFNVLNIGGASLVAQTEKNQPAMQETWVRFLSSLEKEMATHSSILAWEIPWTKEPGGLQFMGSHELDTT